MPKVSPDVLRDRMNQVDRDQVATAAILFCDRLQDFPQEVQVASAALIFQRLCHHSGIHPGTALQVATNVFTDGERVHPTFRGVDNFIKHETLKGAH